MVPKYSICGCSSLEAVSAEDDFTQRPGAYPTSDFMELIRELIILCFERVRIIVPVAGPRFKHAFKPEIRFHRCREITLAIEGGKGGMPNSSSRTAGTRSKRTDCLPAKAAVRIASHSPRLLNN
jgi:hypothetical protein